MSSSWCFQLHSKTLKQVKFFFFFFIIFFLFLLLLEPLVILKKKKNISTSVCLRFIELCVTAACIFVFLVLLNRI